ncbi:MAG: DUF6602 domain-containing protein [Limisphaerales bacterium]
MGSWEDNLPDVSKWQPREDAAERLSKLFFKRCCQIEERIILRARAEKEGVIDNFDSGAGVEDILREEMARLLPSRYSVRCGSIDDRYGRTAGDCDVVIFNDHWFPFIRAGAAEISRNCHFPIEGVYSVIEIKSSLSFSILDDAMSKRVACSRLHRPITPKNRITENRSGVECSHSVVNPLYTAVVAVGLAPKITFEDVINRFFLLCKKLQRHEVVRSLCVLGEGTVTWGVRGPNEWQPAMFVDDYDKPIFPTYHQKDSIGSALYPFANDLLLNLWQSLLSPENLQTKYGLGKSSVKTPKNPDVCLLPGEAPQFRDPENPDSAIF